MSPFSLMPRKRSRTWVIMKLPSMPPSMRGLRLRGLLEWTTVMLPPRMGSPAAAAAGAAVGAGGLAGATVAAGFAAAAGADVGAAAGADVGAAAAAVVGLGGAAVGAGGAAGPQATSKHTNATAPPWSHGTRRGRFIGFLSPLQPARR